MWARIGHHKIIWNKWKNASAHCTLPLLAPVFSRSMLPRASPAVSLPHLNLNSSSCVPSKLLWLRACPAVSSPHKGLPRSSVFSRPMWLRAWPDVPSPHGLPSAGWKDCPAARSHWRWCSPSAAESRSWKNAKFHATMENAINTSNTHFKYP